MAPRINIPPLTRILLVVLVTQSILNMAIRYRYWADGIVNPYLTIVPNLSLFYPWVFVTATLVEQNVFTLLITGATIFYGGKYLERAWSSSELGKFLLIVTLVSNVFTATTYLLWFALTTRELPAICGGVAVQASFLVAFKQLVPEHTVTIAKGLLKIRVKHFPALFLLFNTFSGVFFGTDTALFLSWFGFLSSWIYLRFYRTTPSLSAAATGDSSTIRGDASETFAFAYFFPDAIHGPIAAVADVVYNTFVAMRVCTPFSAADIDAGNEQALARADGGLPSLLGSGRPGGQGGKREEAQRRRALALKALDQRLHAASNRTHSPAAAGPSVLGETNYTPEGQDERGRQEGQAS
ncbi:MAG: hypothetical protein M1819_002792 [Sarea resinae]|nr:MAG: hypothetical protein M1819_002792 [Sarea resinae]